MSEIVALRHRLDSQADSLERLLRENADLQARLALMEAEKRQWQAEKATQQAIIAQRLLAMNAEKEAQAQEIAVLRGRMAVQEDMIAGDL